MTLLTKNLKPTTKTVLIADSDSKTYQVF